MAMPRPSGKAQRIAEKVIPGLRRLKKTNKSRSQDPEMLSYVEKQQTENIEEKVVF